MNFQLTPHLMEKLRKFEKNWGFESELKWKNIFLIIGYHLMAFYWCYLYAFPVKWQSLVYGVIMYIISGSGVTCGAHRLWTHRTYKATLPLNIYLVMCYASVGQNPIYNWVRDHRLHHKYSDTDADPHNIKRGFFFSHVGWLMMKTKNAALEKGRQIDMSDIEADPVLMFEKKYSFYLGIIFCHILPTLGCVYLCNEEWKCAVAWMNFVRVLVILHSEWSVNSFAHTLGNKPYNPNITPTENFFVTFFTGGEGWHNYHHMFPYDYKASEIFESGFSTAHIKFWAKIGLAYDLKEPSRETIDAVVKRHNNYIKSDREDYEYITQLQKSYVPLVN